MLEYYLTLRVILKWCVCVERKRNRLLKTNRMLFNQTKRLQIDNWRKKSMTSLTQPVDPANPIVFLDIKIGPENGKYWCRHWQMALIKRIVLHFDWFPCYFWISGSCNYRIAKRCCAKDSWKFPMFVHWRKGYRNKWKTITLQGY